MFNNWINRPPLVSYNAQYTDLYTHFVDPAIQLRFTQ